jgi:hypothetical protein
VVVAWVVKVSAAVTDAVPEMGAGWDTAQVGAPVAPAGLEVTAQARLTLPVKPPLGATVMVDVAAPPCVTVAGEVPLSVKDPVV